MFCGSVSDEADDLVSLLATSTEIMWWFLSNITCFFIDWSSLKEEYDEVNFFDSSAEKYQNKKKLDLLFIDVKNWIG